MGLVTGVVLILERLPKALVKGVSGALGNEVPGVLALVLTKRVVLLLPDPWALGVLSTPTMLAINKQLRSPKRPESHNCKSVLKHQIGQQDNHNVEYNNMSMAHTLTTGRLLE